MDEELSEELARLKGVDHSRLSIRGSSAVHELERRFQVQLPDEFRAYLAEAAPDIDWMHGTGIELYGPERLESLKEGLPEGMKRVCHSEIEAEASKYIIFGDYLDWCGYGYAICCSDGPNRGKIAMIGGTKDHFVASTFFKFLELAEDDSDRLHSTVGDHYTILV